MSLPAIVDGDLEVVDAGRRNQNLKVVRHHGPRYLIKQPGEGERGTAATLRIEAAFYAHCHSEPDCAEMRTILPGLHSFDEEGGLLVIELVEGRPLWGRYGSSPAPEFLASSAAPLGEAVATIHRTFREPSLRAAPWIAAMHAAPPWIFDAHRPTPDVFANLSPANLHILKLMQKDEAIVAGLDSMRAEWTADTLIHNDLKGDNVLVAPQDNQVRVRVVDWEMIQIGDAAWDVGTVLREFLGYWLLSVPLTADLTPEEMLEGSTWPLVNLHPAARTFWQAYRAAAPLDSAGAGAFLDRSLRYAAARIAQSAYELCLTLRQPTNLAIAMLQVASNILADPREASLHLFGIPVPWRSSAHAPATP